MFPVSRSVRSSEAPENKKENALSGEVINRMNTNMMELNTEEMEMTNGGFD